MLRILLHCRAAAAAGLFKLNGAYALRQSPAVNAGPISKLSVSSCLSDIGTSENRVWVVIGGAPTVGKNETARGTPSNTKITTFRGKKVLCVKFHKQWLSKVAV